MLRRTTKLSLRFGALVAIAYLVKWLLANRSASTPETVPPAARPQPKPEPEPAPEPEPKPEPELEPEPEPEPEAEPEPDPEPEPEPARVKAGNEPDDGPVAEEAPAQEPAPELKAAKKAAKKKAAAAKQPTRKPPEHVPPETPVGALMSWVEPVGNVCPPSHPIKAKLGSRVFRRPGGPGYDLSKPDRCYASEGAAGRAGFQEAQR